MAPISLGDQMYTSCTAVLPFSWMDACGMDVIVAVQFPPQIPRFGKQKFKAISNEIGMWHAPSAQWGGGCCGFGNMSLRPTVKASFEECLLLRVSGFAESSD